MEVVQNNATRQAVGCQRYPDGSKVSKKAREREAGKVREVLANRIKFAAWLKRFGVSTPHSVPVVRGKRKPPTFHFGYPVRVKTALGKKPGVKCSNLAEVQEALKNFPKGALIQQDLTGYRFTTVSVVKGKIDERAFEHISAVHRRICTLLISLGVSDFAFDVATSSDGLTTCIVP